MFLWIFIPDGEFAYDDEMMTLLDEEQALILEEEELLAIGIEYSTRGFK